MPALPVAQRIGQCLYRLLDDAVGLPFVHFEGTHLIDEFIDHVTEIECVEHPHTEVDRELQSGFSACGLDTVRLLEQQDTEAVES